MRRPNRPGWFASNLLLLAATIFVGVLLFSLFVDDESLDVVDAIGLTVFFGALITAPALACGVAYLFLLRRIAQSVSGLPLRGLALLLSPIVMLHLFFVLETWYPLVLALPYGAVVRLPKQDGLPPASA
jgi:predicted neutral ceramidase superfamily lipid hydrolase